MITVVWNCSGFIVKRWMITLMGLKWKMGWWRWLIRWKTIFLRYWRKISRSTTGLTSCSWILLSLRSLISLDKMLLSNSKMENSFRVWRFCFQFQWQSPVRLRFQKYLPVNKWFSKTKSTGQWQGFTSCFQKHFGEENTAGTVPFRDNFLSMSSHN